MHVLPPHGMRSATVYNEKPQQSFDGTEVAGRRRYAAPQLTVLGSVQELTLGGEGCTEEPVVGGFFGDQSPC